MAFTEMAGRVTVAIARLTTGRQVDLETALGLRQGTQQLGTLLRLAGLLLTLGHGRFGSFRLGTFGGTRRGAIFLVHSHAAFVVFFDR